MRNAGASLTGGTTKRHISVPANNELPPPSHQWYSDTVGNNLARGKVVNNTMGGKLLWLGLTIIMMEGLLSGLPFRVIGAIIMIIGCILLFLDK